MKNKIPLLTQTKTLYHSLVSSSFTIINGLLGILFYSLAARFLGPSDYGIFAVALATIVLISDIANVGTDTGIVKFVSTYIDTDRVKALRFLKLGLEVKLISGIVLVIFGWILSPVIVDNILQKPELLLPLRISLVGSATTLLFSYATSSLQALQKFFWWGILNVVLNASRLIFIAILALFGTITVISSISIYILLPAVGFIISLWLLPAFIKVRNERSVAKEFFKYNKWVALFIIVAAVSARLDVYISTRLLSLEDVGIYSVATGLTSVVPQIVVAIATVVAPKLTKLKNNFDAKSYLKQLQVLVIFLAFGGFIVGTFAGWVIIPLLYGPVYSAAFVPFVILLAAQSIFLMSIPAHTSVFYYFSYPKLFVFISVGHLLVISIFAWILINTYGLLGASMAVLIGNIFNFVVPAAWVYNKLNK